MLPTKLLTDTATLPTRGSATAAGLDLYLDLASQFTGIENEDGSLVAWDEETSLTLQSTNRTVLKTGIAVAIPDGFYGQIAPRSGLAVKQGLEILAGVIDSDYRGELMVAVLNSGQTDIQFKHGDRVAQMLILPCEDSIPHIVDDLDDTNRGAGAMGSTGR